MKVLILGGTGMLGHKLVQTLEGHHEVWTTIRGKYPEVSHTGIFAPERTVEDVDVRDFNLLRKLLIDLRPDVVINAVGIIKQVPASNDMADLITINSLLPHVLANMSAQLGYRLICISTDCVFSGERGRYSEPDAADAVDVYGKSKHLGEVDSINCLTIRTSIIGRELATSHSLVEWFLGQEAGPVKGYSRAVYSGFPTIVLSDILADIIGLHRDLSGIVHISSEPISKLELLKLINAEFGVGHDIVPDDSFVIDRSLDSSYFRQITGFRPRTWPDMVRRMAQDPTLYSNIRKAPATIPDRACDPGI